jgi:hypothetical protein
MLVDSRIIQRHGDLSVLAQHLAVEWPDGSTVDLHTVQNRGRDDRYLRALQADPLWLVVDVRNLAGSLATEIPALPWRDTDGLVLHSLRLAYADADALRARAQACYRARWQAVPAPVLATCWGHAAQGASA